MNGDPNIILYEQVLELNQPISFFIKNYDIQDVIEKRLIQYYPFFEPTDLVMTFFESEAQPTDHYIQWVLKNKKMIKDPVGFVYEDLVGIFDWYDENYEGGDKLRQYFKNKTVYYHEKGIENIIEQFNVNQDLHLFDIFMTQEDINFLEYESELIVYVDEVNQFKQRYIPHLDYITYDTGTLIVEYKKWVINVEKRTEKDKITAKKIQQFNDDLNTTISIKTSPPAYDQYIQYFEPEIGNRFVDVHDALDLFHESTTSITYKNDETLYKVVASSIVPAGNESQTLYMHGMTYDMKTNKLAMINTKQPNPFPSITIGEPVNYNSDGDVYLWDVEMDEARLLQLILLKLNHFIFSDDKKLRVQLRYQVGDVIDSVNKIVKFELIQMFHVEDKVVNMETKTGIEKIKLMKNKRKYIPYIHVKFKNVYHYPSFLQLVKSLVSISINGTSTNNTLIGRAHV